MPVISAPRPPPGPPGPSGQPARPQRLPVRLQGCLAAGCERRLHVSAGRMEFLAQLHGRAGRPTLGPGPGPVRVQLQLPSALAEQEAQSPCFVSQLSLFRGSPAPWGRAPGQVPWSGTSSHAR